MKKKRQRHRIIFARIVDSPKMRKVDPYKEPKIYRFGQLVGEEQTFLFMWPEKLAVHIPRNGDPLELAVTFKDLRKREVVK